MGYLHIENLAKNTDIFLFRKCWALEKIHGTSAHVAWNTEENKLRFFSGGASQTSFEALFDAELLTAAFKSIGRSTITVYGEAYGGGGTAGQGMKATYGPTLRFIAFDVFIEGLWLAVPQAVEVTKVLGIEFVHYEEVEANLERFNQVCYADSVQAVRNGMGPGHVREGVVLRPLIELTKNNGARIIAKLKRHDFEERATPPPVMDEVRLQVLTEADKIAAEWVTEMRLTHVLDKLMPNAAVPTVKDMPRVLAAMAEDVSREAAGEIVESKEASRAISKRTAELFKARLKGMA